MTIIDPGPIPPVQPDDDIASAWGNAVAGRTVARYATVAERDAQGTPPAGALCWVAETRYLYVAAAAPLGWQPMTVPFSKLVGATHPAFSGQAAATEYVVGTATLAAATGTVMRVNVDAQQMIDLAAAAAAGDQWELRLYGAGALKAASRVALPRAGAQLTTIRATWMGTLTAGATTTVESRLIRLTGTATATGVLDGNYNRTWVATAAAYPY